MSATVRFDPDARIITDMRAAILAATLLLAAPALAQPDPLALVGRPLPAAGSGAWVAWERQDAWEIDGDANGAAARLGWTVWTREGEAIVFLLREERVADAVRVEVPAGLTIGFACTPAGASGPDPAVVALVDDPPLPPGARCVFSSPRRAWRLDRDRDRIAPAPAANLRCQRSCPWD
jgi:hypothetical protein